MKFPILISYAYARQNQDSFAEAVASPNIDVLLDCGAFTAKNAGAEITLDDYCQFLDKWKSKLFAYLALDVVGDPAKTEWNLKEMLRNGYKPSPVHVLGDTEKKMDELFEISDYVALAGLRRPHKGQCPKEYVVEKMRWAKGRRVHWLGYVRENMFRSLAPYSCDSASWKSSLMFGGVKLYLGTGKWLSCTYKTRHKAKRNRIAMNLISSLGFSIKQFDDPNCWRAAKKKGYSEFNNLSNIVTAHSWFRYVIDVRKQFGTRIFLASDSGSLQERASLYKAIESNADKLHLDTVSV
jgi:hypothetical protein